MTSEFRTAPGSLFPVVVDNTMRETLNRCQKAAYWAYERGLRPVGPTSIDLHAGLAFAKGLEKARSFYFDKGENAAYAIRLGVEACTEAYGDYVPPETKYPSAKTGPRMAGAVCAYFDKHPLNAEEPVWKRREARTAIEQPFSFHTGLRHPVTGFPLHYAGRYDYMHVRDGAVWGVENKTGKEFDAAWCNQWVLNSQITGYCWVGPKLLEKHNIDLPFGGVEIHGTGITTKGYNHIVLSFKREQWEIDRWFEQMTQDFAMWAIAHEDSRHSMALGHGCAQYGRPCDFAKLCSVPDPELLVEGNFVINRWNPLDDH